MYVNVVFTYNDVEICLHINILYSQLYIFANDYYIIVTVAVVYMCI